MAHKLLDQRTKRQTAGDLLVGLIALPLLVTCAVLLHSCMRSDWVRNPEKRWRILGLGLSLLLVTLLVCMYATYRLGLCIWAAQQQQTQTGCRTRRRTTSSRGTLPYPLPSNDSQMQLMVSGELPPSYDSVVNISDLPPPYCSVVIASEKGATSRSPIHPNADILGTG